MLDTERATLKENAGALANLLTENVPSLLDHYLGKDVLSESEKEAITSAGSAEAIKIKLMETLAEKKEVSIDAIMEGLNATENQCVSKELDGLLSEKKGVDNGSGDKVPNEELSAVAIKLVDEVIAKAEETLNAKLDSDEMAISNEVTASNSADNEIKKDQSETEELHDLDDAASASDLQNSAVDGRQEEESNENTEKLVEAEVEVHYTKEEEKAEEEQSQEVNGQSEIKEDEVTIDQPDRSVKFSDTVEAIIDNTDEYEESEEKAEDNLNGNGLDAHESDEEANDDELDNEIVERKAESNNNEVEKVANGGHTMTRMDSNDIILDGDNSVSSNDKVSTGDEGLDSILARKALVRNQVEKFEKSSPAPVKYSFRSSTKQDSPPPEVKSSEGSNVKNLKNFFQRLSTTNENTSPASGAVKPVGKLKVTFPASS